jgi:predicted DNA-binding protein with PD1-like motif
MKIIIQEKIIRFDQGDEVIAKLLEYCNSEHIEAAYFTGLGACATVTLAYYDLEKKKYVDKKFEDLEIVSLTGNVAKLAKDTIIHAHGVFGDKHYQTVGGHIKELIVSATCEVHLSILKGKMRRSYDNTTGLNLLQ